MEQRINNYITDYNNKHIELKLKGPSPIEFRTQSSN
ncbi:IS3 family transposase [Lonepinella sp. MS14434]